MEHWISQAIHGSTTSTTSSSSTQSGGSGAAHRLADVMAQTHIGMWTRCVILQPSPLFYICFKSLPALWFSCKGSFSFIETTEIHADQNFSIFFKGSFCFLSQKFPLVLVIHWIMYLQNAGDE